MNNDQAKQFCHRTRREFLWQGGASFATVALSAMLGEGFFAKQARGADGVTPFHPPLSPKPAISKPKAKSVIFLFMYGGPSQVDTFDFKPKLYGLDGQTVSVKTFGRGGKRDASRVVGPKWNFQRYGQCGKYISDLFPCLGQYADDMAFIHSMTADSPLHGSAMLQMNTGKILSGNPCLGSWVNYGLGSVSQNLPGFVVMLDKSGGPISGAKNWSSGYMPATYQGTVLRPTGEPILDLKMPSDHGMTPSAQRRLLNTLEAYNQEHEQTRAGNSDLAARIASYELAYKMQQYAPEAVDLSSEPAHIKELYGVDKPRTHQFGSKCLLARRLVERGVRFVQLYSGGAHDQIDGNWDAHVDIVKNHSYNAGNTDQPIAALLKDLKQRGLLEETLVIWGGEFGRQPTAENESGTGRDHNAYGFTMWMAGGGIKGGVSFGQTDELGSAAIDGAVKVKNLHATVLQLLGCDPNRLTYFFGGLNQKLVGVEGAEPINQIIA